MSQIDLFSNSNATSEVLYEYQDASIIYYPNFFERDYKFTKELNWRQDQITIFGKTSDIPRLQAWYSDSKDYSYSGIKLERNFFTSELAQLKEEIEFRTKNRFNGCLCNLYRNGEDYVGWHSDDESELGRNPVIASASFGETRRMVFKHRFDKGIEKFEIELEDRSLLIMQGSTQHFWKHYIPKTKKYNGERVNLTFRRIL